MSSIRISLAASAALGVLAAAADAQTRVQILHASDLEGGVDAIDDAPNFAAVVEFLEGDAASSSIPSLVLSAGDNYIPGPFFSSAGDFSLRGVFRSVLGNADAREGEGRADISIMNLIGFDASAVGNHEFDNGPGTFAGLIGTDIRNGFTQPRWLGAQFPYLSSNLDFSGEPSLASLFTNTIQPSTAFRSTLSNLPAAAAAPKLAPATVVMRGSEMFGVVGGTTPLVETISSTGGVTVRDPGAGTNNMADLAAIIQPQIDNLRNAGVDKIILVTHLQQFVLEQTLTPLLSGIDIVIAGGSDTLLADGNDRLRAGDTAQGTYPTVAQNADGEPVLILSTNGQYKYVGRLVIDFDASGVVVPGSYDPVRSGVFATDDLGVQTLWGNLTAPFAMGTKGNSVKQLTDAVRNIVIARDGNIVGRSDVFLDGRRTPVRTEETNMGDLTADANLAAAKAFDASVVASLKNGGGIRNPIGSINGTTGRTGPTLANPLSGKLAGEVSQLDVENTLRFNNGLVLVTLTPDQFKQTLEHAVSDTAPGNTPGRFGQFGGVSFAFDASQPVGSRINYIALTDPTAAESVIVDDGVVVGTQPIRIVTLDFLLGGGDSYPYQTFITANPSFANVVDLQTVGLPAGASTFAPAGTEQDAFAEFMLANFSATPYADVETAIGDDQRTQQAGTRPSLTVNGTGLPGTNLDFLVADAAPMAFALLALGDRAGRTPLAAGPFGTIAVGIDTALAPFVIGMTDATGALSAPVQVPAGPLPSFFLVGQVLTVAADGATMIATETTQGDAFTVGN